MIKLEDSIVINTKLYYGLEGNGAGGILHIVFDDGNVEDSDIKFCIELAERSSDYIALKLCYDMLSLSVLDRKKIVSRYDEYKTN